MQQRMETLSAAIERLGGHGFRASFRAATGGALQAAERSYAPEDLIVEEIVRFEGQSDPEDQAVLFALSTKDGSVRGTFVATYGTGIGPESAAAIHRLEATPAAERVSGEPGS